MKYYVLYNPATGDILGRLAMSEDQKVGMYENILEITEEDYKAEPEVHKKVHDRRKLIDK